MAIPWKTAAELEEAIRGGSIHETDSLDGKRELPGSKKNVDLATDICAMTPDGGLLIYGVDEGRDKLVLAELTPVELEGQRERITNVVNSGVKPSPKLNTYALPIEGEPGKGYLVVEVPPSPLAPHMVEIKGEQRYYGRSDCVNVRLNEAQVAALYKRREQIEADADELLDDVLAASQYRAKEDLGFAYAFVRPVVSAADRWKPLSNTDWTGVVSSILQQGRSGDFWRETAVEWRPLGVDKRRVMTTWDEPKPEDVPLYFREIQASRDGSVTGFLANAVWTIGRNGPDSSGQHRLVREPQIAGHVEDVFAVAGTLLRASGYEGPADIGVAVTGLQKIHSGAIFDRQHGSPFAFVHLEDYNAKSSDDHKRTTRADVSELLEPRALVAELLGDLVVFTTGEQGFDVFADPQ